MILDRLCKSLTPLTQVSKLNGLLPKPNYQTKLHITHQKGDSVVIISIGYTSAKYGKLIKSVKNLFGQQSVKMQHQTFAKILHEPMY